MQLNFCSTAQFYRMQLNQNMYYCFLLCYILDEVAGYNGFIISFLYKK